MSFTLINTSTSSLLNKKKILHEKILIIFIYIQRKIIFN